MCPYSEYFIIAKFCREVHEFNFTSFFSNKVQREGHFVTGLKNVNISLFYFEGRNFCQTNFSLNMVNFWAISEVTVINYP